MIRYDQSRHFPSKIEDVKMLGKDKVEHVYNELFHPSKALVKSIEMKVIKQAKQFELMVKNQTVRCYSWNEGLKPILLIHGWGSRASRFYYLIHKLISNGYSPVSFDCLGHGDSDGNHTDILDYHLAIKSLYEIYGVFESIISHSFGVIAGLYSIKKGVLSKSHVVLSGSGSFKYGVNKYASLYSLNSDEYDFLVTKIEQYFDLGKSVWDEFSIFSNLDDKIKNMLIIHDKDDDIIEYKQSIDINNSFPLDSKLILTNGSGHNGVLINATISQRIIEHINMLN